jgi:protein-S-isoprenylcysteine O-methyltransferase Ste14
LRASLLGAGANAVLLASPALLAGRFDLSVAMLISSVTLWCLLEARAVGLEPRTSRDDGYHWLARCTAVIVLAIFLIAILDHSEASLWRIPGLVLMVVGIWLRCTAIGTLGDYFLSEVCLVAGQPLVTRGIYSSLRHPSEAGTLCICLGCGLWLGSTLAAVGTLVLLLPAVLVRISIEDAMLARQYPEFPAYRCRVGALVPVLFQDSA